MTDRTVLSNSAVMAAGTVVSRLSGYVRSILLAAALGNTLHAEVFTIANTIPNMLYILLAGGVFNAVLVPQLVRAMQHHPDRGEAYTNRIITLAGLFLAAVTVLLVAFAPLVMSVYLDPSWAEASHAEQRESVIDFARYCLPQVFFYGMFVLVGQILNARGTFGPMMWAPIANNVVSMAVLVTYLVVFGARGVGGYTPGEELLLGLGSTLGIALQLLILIPYLKAAGFTYRPRFDFRNSGLGHTMRLATWTVLFVIVNQVAYTVVVRLASSGPAESSDGTGYTIYSQAFLMIMVPHAVVTVSLATAILPTLSARAAEHRLDELAGTLGSTLRTTLALIIPFALLLPLLASDVANLVWGYGAAAETVDHYVPSLALFAPGLLVFTIHYLMLRGFFALEQTRTVFWIQCVIATCNIGLGVLLVHTTDASFTSPALVLAYTGAYAVGAAVSYVTLRSRLGTLHTRTLLGFVARTGLAALVAVSLAGAAWWGLDVAFGDRPPSKVGSVLELVALTVVHLAVFLALARLLRIREVTDLVRHATRRLPMLRRS